MQILSIYIVNTIGSKAANFISEDAWFGFGHLLGLTFKSTKLSTCFDSKLSISEIQTLLKDIKIWETIWEKTVLILPLLDPIWFTVHWNDDDDSNDERRGESCLQNEQYNIQIIGTELPTYICFWFATIYLIQKI